MASSIFNTGCAGQHACVISALLTPYIAPCCMAAAGSACNRSIASALCRYVGGFVLPIWLNRRNDDDKKAALQEAMTLLQDGVFTPQAGMNASLCHFSACSHHFVDLHMLYVNA